MPVQQEPEEEEPKAPKEIRDPYQTYRYPSAPPLYMHPGPHVSFLSKRFLLYSKSK